MYNAEVVLRVSPLDWKILLGYHPQSRLKSLY